MFVISKTGEVTDVSIARGVHPLLDKEAIRVVRELPAWTPGEQNGKVVAVRYAVPVWFYPPDPYR